MDRVARGDDGGARDFFEGYARDFDHIYDEGGKGVLARFVDPAHRPKLETDEDNLRLIEDLALDSLTLMEIVMLTEEVLPITIDNEDLRRLRTVGDVKNFVAFKVRSLPASGGR